MGDKTKPWKPRRKSKSDRRELKARAEAVKATHDIEVPHNAFRFDERLADPKRQCNRKHPFTVESAAVKVARMVEERAGVPIRAYLCPHCGLFHIGGYNQQRQ